VEGHDFLARLDRARPLTEVRMLVAQRLDPSRLAIVAPSMMPALATGRSSSDSRDAVKPGRLVRLRHEPGVLTQAATAHKHRVACQRLGLKHLFTQPYRPRTNGKAERFIQTLTRSWARGRLYANSAERTAALDAWLEHYNFTRPHGSLSHKPPGSRLTKAPGNYT
jgi:transposase InsO family protein